MSSDPALRAQISDLARRLKPELMKVEADNQHLHELQQERDRLWGVYEASVQSRLEAQKIAVAKGEEPARSPAVTQAASEEERARTAMSAAAAAASDEFAAAAGRTATAQHDLTSMVELYQDAIARDVVNPFDVNDPLTRQVLPYVGRVLRTYNPNSGTGSGARA